MCKSATASTKQQQQQQHQQLPPMRLEAAQSIPDYSFYSLNTLYWLVWPWFILSGCNSRNKVTPTSPSVVASFQLLIRCSWFKVTACGQFLTRLKKKNSRHLLDVIPREDTKMLASVIASALMCDFFLRWSTSQPRSRLSCSSCCWFVVWHCRVLQRASSSTCILTSLVCRIQR